MNSRRIPEFKHEFNTEEDMFQYLSKLDKKLPNQKMTTYGSGTGYTVQYKLPESTLDYTDSTNPKDLLGIKKSPLHLVPPSAIIYLADGFEDGAAKYGSYNWREKKVQSSIYIAAALRHLLAYEDGEETAEDSGRHHLAHAMACLAILVDAKETGNLVDNRPIKGAAASMLKQREKK